MEIISGMSEKVDRASKGYSLSIESALQLGFNIFRRAPAEFIIFSILGVIIFSNPVTGVLLGGPVTGSYLHMAHRANKDQPIHSQDFFKGFERTGGLIKLNLLILMIVLAGLALLVLPGIYLAVSYIFSHHFTWFYKRSPRDSIQLSRKTVSGNFGQIFLLFLILTGINLLGVMALGVGILLTMPLSFCVLYAAFDDIIGITN
jgi:hypothetical protein